MAAGDDLRRRHRRLFAAAAGFAALALMIAGSVLVGRDGVLNVIGLACLAYGIGVGVAAAFIALDRNPLAKSSQKADR